MEKPILLVGGGKGGVGKSLLSVALVDYVAQQTGGRSWSKPTPRFRTSSRPTAARSVPSW